MLDGNRLRIILSTLAIALSVWFAWYFEPKTPSVRDTEASSEQRRGNYEGSVTCEADCQVSFGFANRPAGGEHQKAKTDERLPDGGSLSVSESDLLAQERMAYWTRVIGIFTAAGLGILYITFGATRDAVIETRKIGQAQTGCYPAITKITLRIGNGQNVSHVFSDESPEYMDFKAGLYPELRWTVENYGQTPAYDFAIWPSVKYKIMGEPAKTARTSPQRGPSPGDGITLQQKIPRSQSGVVPFPLTQTEVNATDSPLHPLEVYVLLRLRYIDVFDEVHEPKLAFYGMVHRGNLGTEIDLGTIPLEIFEKGMQSVVAVKYPAQS